MTNLFANKIPPFFRESMKYSSIQYLGFLIWVLTTVEGHNRQPEENVISNVRQQQQVKSQELTPELQEFKDEMIAALEIPDAVKLLHNLFGFLSAPLDVTIEALESVSTETNQDKQVQGEEETESNSEATPTQQIRQLNDVEISSLQIPHLSGVAPTPEFTDSVLSLSEIVEAANRIEDLPEFEDSSQLHIDDGDVEVDSIASRVRRLQILNSLREATGEIVGDILFGKSYFNQRELFCIFHIHGWILYVEFHIPSVR